jgi:serine/threonine protein kinase
MRDQELAYLRRVGTLSAAAEAVEREAYQPGSLDAIGNDDDELGRLARVFDRMVTGMRSRQERLQRRLGQLRHEMQEARSRGSGSHAEVSDDSPFAAGQVIAGRYEVLGELGKGGMGMVYHARDRELGEEIALKVVRRDLVAHDPSLVERLKSEIRLARRISHRNVVRAHDLGEWEGVHFLTMEYVKGITVEDLLNTQGRLTVESTLAIGSQVAEALAVAHEQQIIHRDIKPANLLVDDEGRLKVMDFGLARLEASGGRLTSAGLVVGTPGYLAPELILGGEADARSDLFSAGAVLYECLTGRPPFDAASPMKVVDRVLAGGHEPIRTRAPATPAALIALIERLLAREPQDRIGSARELGDQLEQLGAARA